MKRHGRIFKTRFEVRDDGGPLIVGHGAVFNSESVDLGGWREVIHPGAFKKTLRENKDILSFFNHNPSQVLGRTSSETLTVAEDLEGLAYQVRPPETQWARDLIVSMERGDIRGSSFMFDVPMGKSEWKKSPDGFDERHVYEARLYELGPVTMPAYPAADSSVRSLLADLTEAAGFDFRGLASVLARARDGVGLTQADHALVATSIDVLRQLPAPTPSEPPQAGHSLARLRQRLALVARS